MGERNDVDITKKPYWLIGTFIMIKLRHIGVRAFGVVKLKLCSVL